MCSVSWIYPPVNYYLFPHNFYLAFCSIFWHYLLMVFEATKLFPNRNHYFMYWILSFSNHVFNLQEVFSVQHVDHLKYSHNLISFVSPQLLLIIFLFAALIGHFTALSLSSPFLSSASPSWLLNPSSVFQLLYSSALWLQFGTFLCFLSLCEVVTVFISSFPKFGEHLYEHYFELFIR